MTPWLDLFLPQVSIAGIAVFLAIVIDVFFGEPRARLHPVVWMGRYLDWAGKRIAPAANTPYTERSKQVFWWGAWAWIAGALVVIAAACFLQWTLAQFPWWITCLGLGILLKPLMAWNMLQREVSAVEDALGESLAAGRERLSWLCSRDVRQLSATEVRESAIESLAENLNDSVVAPLFWFMLLGLPGAALYRFANTADAMWGYIGPRSGRDWTWAGKWAAHADDILSWIPARLTALLLAVTTGGLSFSILRVEALRTPSPNGGWPMAAMALALDIRLGKPGVYSLHPQGRRPQSEDTKNAVLVSRRVVIAVTVLGIVLSGVWRIVT
ncbi:adenosylcobinamide-phosphate synthase CbiB [Noviherbaspirillum sedimenti]|uniref:Cobalamin biosynthesis protein CobD n=1 Tax=Noviherbaspirillum sedimenti TaxID=2320865 RepID=A0A3A3FVX4_9BURK|nr:adenosylcobinamide-phosphate synthase CbiB [Noviherbaspirillum sedimenti]RJG00353.1 cobalamin biosynthesis protein CobD [Noviherbaspirillum sedimenti]